jgi:hypothetical protein
VELSSNDDRTLAARSDVCDTRAHVCFAPSVRGFLETKMRFWTAILLVAALGIAAARTEKSPVGIYGEETVFAGARKKPDAGSFVIYDNLFYRGKPDTLREGLVPSNIIYEGKIWPRKSDYGSLPNRAEFQATVRDHIANPGPLVLDIEELPLKGPQDVALRNLEVLTKLADWAREAAPGKFVGYYGTNTLSNVPSANLGYAWELARHVDAFFPPMYTFDDDRAKWERRAKAAQREARQLDDKKPVYFYMWPQYHDGTPKQFQFIDASYWKFQLETARRYSDGIVLWSPSRNDWNDATGWWTATVEFSHAVRGAQSVK